MSEIGANISDLICLSVVCLLSALNVFENKKGIIKIVVSSSVININEMDVIFFGMITTSGNG